MLPTLPRHIYQPGTAEANAIAIHARAQALAIESLRAANRYNNMAAHAQDLNSHIERATLPWAGENQAIQDSCLEMANRLRLQAGKFQFRADQIKREIQKIIVAANTRLGLGQQNASQTIQAQSDPGGVRNLQGLGQQQPSYSTEEIQAANILLGMRQQTESQTVQAQSDSGSVPNPPGLWQDQHSVNTEHDKDDERRRTGIEQIEQQVTVFQTIESDENSERRRSGIEQIEQQATALQTIANQIQADCNASRNRLALVQDAVNWDPNPGHLQTRLEQGRALVATFLANCDAAQGLADMAQADATEAHRIANRLRPKPQLSHP